MAAGAWVFTYNAATKVLSAGFDFESDSFKMALHANTGTVPTTAATTWAGLDSSEVAQANGYTDGGIAVDLGLSGATGTIKCDIATDPVWTASGGSITARWAVIYEVGGDVVCYALLDATPADVTVTNGNTLTVAAHANGVFTLATA